MAVLYLVEQGAVLRKASRRLVVEKEDRTLLEVPEFKVERVMVFGNVQLTTQAVGFLLERGIETAFFTLGGQLKGKLSPLESKNIPLRLFQYKRHLDESFRTALAGRLVAGKIRNQVVMLQRFRRNHPEVDFSVPLLRLAQCLNALPRKNRVSTLLGVEGVATAVYFEAFGQMFRRELRFQGRTRRPPTDPANALLSLGYTLVGGEILSHLSGTGFDPYIGYLHGIEYGRASLALDMLEEFRHPVVDRLALSLLNREILGAVDFEARDGGVYLAGQARKTFFSHYEKTMTGTFVHGGVSTSFRKLFRVQARRMAAAIQREERYVPFLLK